MSGPLFQVFLDDLFDGVFGAILAFIGAVFGAIGELFLLLSEAIFGSDSPVVVVPVGCVSAVVLVFGASALTADAGSSLITMTAVVIAGVLILFLLLAILLASRRRSRREP